MKLTTKQARRLAAKRKTHAGGRPPKPSNCRKCGALCSSYTHARAHCAA